MEKLDLRYNYVKLKDRGCRRSILRGCSRSEVSRLSAGVNREVSRLTDVSRGLDVSRPSGVSRQADVSRGSDVSRPSGVSRGSEVIGGPGVSRQSEVSRQHSDISSKAFSYLAKLRVPFPTFLSSNFC